MKYAISFTAQFKRDLKLAKKQGKDLSRLFAVIETLASGGTLAAKHRDHALSGAYHDVRECHVEPDWLLLYQRQERVLVLMLYRLGTHSDLFGR